MRRNCCLCIHPPTSLSVYPYRSLGVKAQDERGGGGGGGPLEAARFVRIMVEIFVECVLLQVYLLLAGAATV